MKTHFPTKLFVVLFLIAAVRSTEAATLSIDWFKVAGGGGNSASATYSVSGTVGQADASAVLSGGNFSLTGGYWSILAPIESAGAPLLTIARVGGNAVVVSWPAPSTGFVLQQSHGIGVTSWSDVLITPTVVNGRKQVTFALPSSDTFFRLRK